MTELLERCTEIGSLAKPGRIKYSICTLVNDREEYESMVASFVAGGFSFDDCEYIYADNCSYNKYDAYRAYNTFLAAAAGEYIILCHQDVTLIHDGRAELCRVIEEMDRLDPDWAILGNAGVKEDGGVALRISDPYGEDTCRGQLPARVESVDENFIVVRRTANLAVSHDLFGFHFYGADLCIMASILGYRAYVVDFHLCHKGRGTYDATFFQLREAVCRKYHAAFRTRRVRTMCYASSYRQQDSCWSP